MFGMKSLHNAFNSEHSDKSGVGYDFSFLAIYDSYRSGNLLNSQILTRDRFLPLSLAKTLVHQRCRSMFSCVVRGANAIFQG